MWIIARTSAILIILLSSQVVQSQKIVDTTGVYNGEYTKKRIEFSAGGLTEKETWYYPSGNRSIKIKVNFHQSDRCVFYNFWVMNRKSYP